MRKIILAILMAGGIALVGPPGATAAPFGAAGIGEAAKASSMLQEVQRLTPKQRYRMGVPVPRSLRWCARWQPGLPRRVHRWPSMMQTVPGPNRCASWRHV